MPSTPGTSRGLTARMPRLKKRDRHRSDVERRQVEEPAVEEDGEGGGGEGEVDALEAQGREGDERADDPAHDRGVEQGDRVCRPAPVVRHHDGADGRRSSSGRATPVPRSPVRGTSDSAMRARPKILAARSESASLSTLASTRVAPTMQAAVRRAVPHDGRGMSSRDAVVLLVRSCGFGHGQQHDEEHHGRDREPERREVDVAGRDVADGVGVGEPEDEGTHEGHGQAAEPPEDGRGVGVHDQQREVEVVHRRRGRRRGSRPGRRASSRSPRPGRRSGRVGRRGAG